jgi:histidyl-tRNA synthetase
LLAQLQYCEENQIPFAIILGDSELERGVVKLREISTRKEDEIKREFLTEELNQRIGKLRN